jgi:hypothetical protein
MQYCKAILEINQECIGFSDRRFTFQVGKLLGYDLRQQKKNPVLRLGGTEDTGSIQEIEVGSYREAMLDNMNEKTWKTLTN